MNNICGICKYKKTNNNISDQKEYNKSLDYLIAKIYPKSYYQRLKEYKSFEVKHVFNKDFKEKNHILLF
jgi:hypothetical protein